jgi:mono/diheme cytochrome c family protein
MTTPRPRRWLLAFALVAGCGRALAGPPASAPEPDRERFHDGHSRPRDLVVDARGDLLYVALSTADRLAIVDIASGRAQVLFELPTCAFPDALAALPTGGVVVACRSDPGLRVLSRAAPSAARNPRFDERIVDAGPEHGHQGIVLHPGGRFVYVASPPRGGVKIVDLGLGDAAAVPPRFVPTGLSPRTLRLVAPDPTIGGSQPLLLVSNLIGHTVTVHEVHGDGGLSAARQTIVTEAPVLDLLALPSTGTLAGDTSDDLRGALLLATHEDRVLSRAHLAVEGLDSVVLVLPRTAAPGQGPAFVDAGPGQRRSFNLTERQHEPLVGLDALAFDPSTARLAVVGAGSDNVLVGAPRVDTLLSTLAATVGAHPSAVAFLPDGRAVTADRLSDTLSFLQAGAPGPAVPGKVQTVTVGRSERRTPADRGEVLFYSRALTPNNVAVGPLSLYTCAGCHVDGHIDGRRHPSKRNRFFSMTKTCRGLIGTEPFLSIGKPDTFEAFADNIVATHAQGALEAPGTFDRYPVSLRMRQGNTWATVTLSPEETRVALAAYMARIPVERSPFVAPDRRALTAAERRGLATFREDCAGCHRLSRSASGRRAIGRGDIETLLLAGQVALTSARLYDVGTPVLGEGGNNPPSLRGVWAAAPYFSDGSAPTLDDVLKRTNPHAAKIHAPQNAELSSAFPATVRDDLLAFLRAL